MCKTATAIAFVLALGLSAHAQTTSGSLAGTVVDSQHGAMPNVVVTALEQEKRFTLTAKSDEAGRFVFAQVPPGTYTVTAQNPGFKKYERTGIVLNANDRLSIGDVVMEVGAVAERSKSRPTSCNCRPRARSAHGARLETNGKYCGQQPQLSRSGEARSRSGQHGQPATAGRAASATFPPTARAPIRTSSRSTASATSTPARTAAPT